MPESGFWGYVISKLKRLGNRVGPEDYQHIITRPLPRRLGASRLLRPSLSNSTASSTRSCGAWKHRSLLTLDIGGNDLFKALDELHAGRISPSMAGTAIAQAEANTVHAVEELFALGARNLLFYEVPDLGLAPHLSAEGPAWQNLASGLAKSFDQTVLSDPVRSSTWASRFTTCPPMLTSIWSPAILPTSPPNTASASQM